MSELCPNCKRPLKWKPAYSGGAHLSWLRCEKCGYQEALIDESQPPSGQLLHVVYDFEMLKKKADSQKFSKNKKG